MVYWFERGGFLILSGMPRPVLGESCTTSIKDFAIFPPHQKKKKKKNLSKDGGSAFNEAHDFALIVHPVFHRDQWVTLAYIVSARGTRPCFARGKKGILDLNGRNRNLICLLPSTLV